MATITLPNIGGDIYAHGWLLIALGVGSVGQRPAAWMISAYPIIELYQDILPLLMSEALKV